MTKAPRIHGGTDAQGSARHDFSTNGNACGPNPVALAMVQAADATRYPDANYTRLRDSLAALHGVERWRIVLAGSASEFIFRITAWVRQMGHSEYWMPAQSYGDYGHAADAWSLQRTDDIEQAALVWACEPSSPIGRAHTQWPSWLGADAARSNTHTLVLDCAYAPLRLSGTESLSAEQRDHVWQLYSPNKSLTLTGVRAGYAVAPKGARAAAHQLDAMAPSWAVGVHGEAMLLAWSQPEVQQWLRECLPTLAEWKASQVAMLEEQGWTCLPSDAHFFCAEPPSGLDLQALLPALRTQGIKLRDATSLGLPGMVRLSVQPPESQQALKAALQNWETFVPVPDADSSMAPLEANV